MVGKNTPTRGNKKNSTIPKISAKVTFIPYASLQAKSRERLSCIHSLVVAMLPVVASKRGFTGPYVTLSTKEQHLPATLILDKNVKDNVALVSRGDSLYGELSEGEDITITSGCPSLFAEEVSFNVLSMGGPDGVLGLTKHLKEQLVHSGLLIRYGMKVVMQYLTQEMIMEVNSIKSFGFEAETSFCCIPQTRVSIQASEQSNRVARSQVTFRDIGGYESELENMHKVIDAMFTCGGLRSNISKGILISGPSGCGKTLIGRALESKYGRKFMQIPLEEVKSKYLGETEQNLTHYFAEAAKRAPCLLFMDDIDLLCGSRDKGGSTGVVTALLHLLDGITETADGVMVIATATRPQSLDTALRRPGRLSYDVVLGVPGPMDRRAILHNLLIGVENDLTSSEVLSLADMTHGYLGGDLRNMVLTAVAEACGSPLTWQHLEAALAHTRPALVKDSVSTAMGIKFSNIFGYGSLKNKLCEAVSLTLKHGSVFKQCGFSPPSRFLLFGPPGCGKSTFVSALAAYFHLNIIPVKRSNVLGKYFGESEQNLAKIFQQASESSPCIIHFENFEGLAGRKRGIEGGGADAESRVVNHLKVQLDGIVQNEGVFIFAETNRPDMLNKDVIRPGRFHEYHLVDLPSVDDRQCILENCLPPATVTEEVVLDMVTQTQHMTVAEILQVCEDMNQAVEVTESQGTPDPPVPAISIIMQEVLEAAVPNTSTKLVQKYANFAKIYCSDL